jgi:cytochrome c oxidase assembly factor CtaG
MNLLTGTIGLLLLLGFLGFMVVWIKALPLIVIAVTVMLLVIYDFVDTMRRGNSK